MTTFQSTEGRTADPELGEATTPLQATDAEPVLDAFALLDHRTARRAIPAGLAPTGHYLAVADGELTYLIRLEATIMHVGRGGACDVRLEDQRVSRDHAIIARHGRHVRVLDNRSVNGTFVNGQRIVATSVRDGDVVRIGPIALQYLEIP